GTVRPVTALLRKGSNADVIKQALRANSFSFPLILKPEVGERGWHVSKVTSEEELIEYLSRHQMDMIVQEFVDFPLELSIFVYKMPETGEVGVTSICEKHFLQVRGTGRHTLGELIMKQDRAVLHAERLKKKYASEWSEILPDAEIRILEEVGNHCRGTQFINRNKEIDEQIRNVMKALLSSLSGVYYGRFDLRVPSWEDLRNGNLIKIMEFNGA